MRCYTANMQDLIARNIGDDMCAMAMHLYFVTINIK